MEDAVERQVRAYNARDIDADVVDEERVTGTPRGDVHCVAIYQLGGDGLIDRVRFLL